MPLILFIVDHTFLMVTFELSLDTYFCHDVLLACRIVFLVCARSILILSKFAVVGFILNFFNAALRLRIARLQFSSNQGRCRFDFVVVLGILFDAIVCSVFVKSSTGLSTFSNADSFIC